MTVPSSPTPRRDFERYWFARLSFVACGAALVSAGFSLSGGDPASGALAAAAAGVLGWFGLGMAAGATQITLRVRVLVTVCIALIAAYGVVDRGVYNDAVLGLPMLVGFCFAYLERREATGFAAASVAVVAVLALLDPAPSVAVAAMGPAAAAAVRALYLLAIGMQAVVLVHYVTGSHEAARADMQATLEDLRASNRALVAARDEAEEANLAKTAFLANVSHELRTPLNAVVGLTEGLMAEVDDETADRLALVVTSGRSLRRLVDDLLDLARVQSGRIALDRSDFDLRRVLERVVLVHAGPARDRGQQLVIDVDEEVMVHGDEGRVRQVLDLMVNNAAKHAVAGVVDVVAARVDRARVRFEVRDRGPGIDPDRTTQLFDAFDRGGHGRPREGHGLGLTIARAVAEAMGGAVGVETNRYGGSTFWMEVPLPMVGAPMVARLQLKVAVALPDAHPYRAALIRQLRILGCTVVEAGGDARALIAPTRTLSAVEVRGTGGSGSLETLNLPWMRDELASMLRRVEASSVAPAPKAADPDQRYWVDGPVLIVEDNEINRIVARRMLEQLGCEVHTANDGFEAVERFESGQRFAMVFMDIQMPGVDGYETARRIRAMLAERVPIVALTAHALPEHRQASLEHGLDDHLTKPIRKDVLAATLTRWAGAEPRTQSDASRAMI